MKKQIVLVILAVILIAALWCPYQVNAGEELRVVSHSAEISFPTQLIFYISARSDNDINDIRLHYQISRTEHARITSEIYIEFTPAKSVSEQWVWDMRKSGGLPPGSGIDYWWTVADETGNCVRSLPR